MKDLLEFIRDWINSVSERLKIPFFNSLLISWLIINWKIIFIILFSEEPIESRIDIITYSEYSSSWKLYWYPLIAAFTFTTLKPIITWIFHWLLKKINLENWDNSTQYKIDTYTKKIKLAERERDYQIARAKNLNLKELNDRIEVLESEIEQKDSEMSKYLTTNQKHIAELKKKIQDNSKYLIENNKLKGDVIVLLDKISNEIKERISFQSKDEIDGLQLLNFKHKIINQIHWERGPYIEGRNNLYSSSEVEDFDKNGFGYILKAISEKNLTLDGIDIKYTSYALKRNLIFEYKEGNKSYYGLSFLGIGAGSRL